MTSYKNKDKDALLLLQRVPKVTHLGLRGFGLLQVQDLNLPKVGIHLEEVSLLNSPINDDFLCSLVEQCPHLSKLEVGGDRVVNVVYQITDLSMFHIAHHCQHLTSLKVVGCNQLTSSAIQFLVHNLPLLEELCLTNCRGLDEGFLGVDPGRLKLTRVDFSGRYGLMFVFCILCIHIY